MKNKFVNLGMLLAVVCAVPASAITVTDLYGDKDGFGTGVSEDAIVFPWSVVAELDDDGFTDRWVQGTQTWSHIYDLTGFASITSASIEVFTAGQGFIASSELYIDGDYVADLTDGQIGLVSLARKDVFDLSGFAGLLSGANSLEIRTAFDVDLWALDYSEITITGTEDNGPGPQAPVPEPATMTLLGLGLAGLAIRKRVTRA